ncbi:MAG: hypothetical protein WCK31_02095, partial [bacterium]
MEKSLPENPIPKRIRNLSKFLIRITSSIAIVYGSVIATPYVEASLFESQKARNEKNRIEEFTKVINDSEISMWELGEYRDQFAFNNPYSDESNVCRVKQVDTTNRNSETTSPIQKWIDNNRHIPEVIAQEVIIGEDHIMIYYKKDPFRFSRLFNYRLDYLQNSALEIENIVKESSKIIFIFNGEIGTDNVIKNYIANKYIYENASTVLVEVYKKVNADEIDKSKNEEFPIGPILNLDFQDTIKMAHFINSIGGVNALSEKNVSIIGFGYGAIDAINFVNMTKEIGIKNSNLILANPIPLITPEIGTFKELIGNDWL